MATIKQYYWRYSQIALILILGLLIAREMWVFSGGFLGAFTIYILVRKQMHWLTEVKKFRPTLAAILIMLEVLFCFLIPASVAVVLLIKMIDNLVQSSGDIIASVETMVAVVQEKVEIDLLSKESLLQATGVLTKIGKVVVGEISSFAINAFVLLFVLFFMLLGSRPMEKYVFELLPFNEENKAYMSKQIQKMVLSNAIGIPLLAIVQGITATIAYWIFDVPWAFVFGFLTCFATIIPLVGTALVWAPLVVYLLVSGDWANALGLGIFGLVVISNVDNLFRFLLQKKMADIHPLITVFGVITGLAIYGFWGVIFGPVLISIFLILIDMFKKEYLDKEEKPVQQSEDDLF